MVSKRVRLNPTVRRLLSLIAIVYIALCIVLYFFQRDLLYFPTAQSDHGLETFELNNEGETLNIIVANKGHAKALIYFGGNHERVANSAADYAKDFPNHTLYFANYRAYGGSTGSPTEQALYSDALALFDVVQKKHPFPAIMGRSLGTGVATYVAVNRIIDKLILITPYDSIEAIAQGQYPFFPISLMLKDRFDSVSRAALINVPTIIIVAEKDTLIPTDNTLHLVRAIDPKYLTVKAFKGAGHNNVSHLDAYHQTLKNFMNTTVH